MVGVAVETTNTVRATTTVVVLVVVVVAVVVGIVAIVVGGITNLRIVGRTYQPF